MRTNRFRPSVGSLVVLLLAVAIIAPSYALMPGRQLPNPVVAYVDLEQVFNQIEALNQAQTRVEEAMVPHRQEADRLRQEAERLREDLELYVPGTEKYEKAEKAWTRAVLDYRAMVGFIEAKLDALRAEARADIFREITDSAAKYAENNGIDYIVTNDATIPLQQGNDIQIVQQLALRRVVYANPALDITTELIAWINTP